MSGCGVWLMQRCWAEHVHGVPQQWVASYPALLFLTLHCHLCCPSPPS